MPTLSGFSSQGPYNCGSEATQITYTGVTSETTVQNYLTDLEDAGFYCVSSNTESSVGNQFYSYRYGTQGVHVSWYPNYEGGLFRIIQDTANYQPSLTKETTTAVVEPTVAQLSREATTQSAPGMGYVIQLSDGRYIIVDGGPWSSNDAASLVTYLRNNNPNNGKPVIAGWFFTHAHGDHVELARYVLKNYASQVEVQAVFYNFPQMEGTGAITLTAGDDPTGELKGMATLENNLEAVLDSYWPTTVRYKYQTGESFWIGDAKIDILFTHQDFVHQDGTTQAFGYGNDTSNAFRITINGYEMMFTGDLDITACPELYQMYEKTVGGVTTTELDCHILQVPHHGFNGGDTVMYDRMDPELCFWPVDSTRFTSSAAEHCQSYTNSQHLYAMVDKNMQFHASQTTVVNLSTGEIFVDGTKQSQTLTK